MLKTDINQIQSMASKVVTIAGWVHARRPMGKLVFVDVRDRSGIVQVVLGPELSHGKDLIKSLRPEFVVQVHGTVQERRQSDRSGQEKKFEIVATTLEILSEAKTPPFEIENEDRRASEELRMRYRYLDLRHRRLLYNLTLRHEVIRFIREYLSKRNFLEVETPYLTKGTPEGAREYIVPSRIDPGKFYTLPQSPQQFKQLLMVAGVERYFQIVRCFRDEDTRGDRQPEFTQLDLEMSFIDESDVLSVVEDLFVHLIKAVAPQAILVSKPFPRIPYEQAQRAYGTDKPDLRRNKQNSNELAFAFIVEFPLFEFSDTEQRIVPTHHLFTSPRDSDIDLLRSDPLKVKAKQYDLVLNGFEIGGGSIRIHQAQLQQKIFEVLKLSPQEVSTRFGHMLEAFSYGAPPHGGIAIGIDRLCAILAREPNIREVIAFPKTSDGRDLMMGAPSELPDEQLRQAHIKVISARK